MLILEKINNKTIFYTFKLLNFKIPLEDISGHQNFFAIFYNL